MSALERLLCGLLVAALLSIGAWYGVSRYGIQQRQAGYDAAVADGKEYRDLEAQIARQTEDGLRAQLRAKDAAAFKKEKEHAASLEAAQRRMRAGDDRLRCPAARPIPAATPPADRPATGGPNIDREGLVVVPEIAADLLSLAADHQRLLRNYERVVERFEDCRALNAN